MRIIELYKFQGMMLPLWVKRMAVVTERHGGNLVLLGNICHLILGNFRRCKQLPTLGYLPCLGYLAISGFDVECIGEVFYAWHHDFHVPTLGFFPAMRSLEIPNFHKLMTWLPPPPQPAALAFPNLETLEVVDCPELQTLPMMEFPSLSSMTIQNLGGNQPLDIIKYNTSLTSLHVKGMLEMTRLPQELSNCRFLQVLTIQQCTKLTSLSTGLQYLVSLKELDVRDCPALTFVPDDIFSGFSILRELYMVNLEGLTRIPTSLQGCTSLEKLLIRNCSLIEGSVPDLSLLVGLVELDITDSGKLMDSVLLETALHLPCLEALRMGGFREEDEMRHYFSDVTPLLTLCTRSLTSLQLTHCPSIKSLPAQLQLFTVLRNLVIEEFHELEQVPEWIGNLSSLEALYLLRCENLKYLPTQAIMRRLSQLWLYIEECPLLGERCENDFKPEWHKISNLPYIQIDDEVVQCRR